jgi:hypothetical protein
MTPEPNASDGTARGPWQRFNDEFFSLHATPGVMPHLLVSDLAARGIELILDARSVLDEDQQEMATDCDAAGVYYVPAVKARTSAGLSADVVARYADLALRHKTCVVIEGASEGLLGRMSEQRSIKRTSLDASP